uniref:Uncharacterized protein n=1 Tax=Pyxicephalus adspersus TaxID=30357 RepID=A0AAV3ALV7_PYXAD|nr:TPA: hypothetical protein GDO54_010328 [Pyxicephalus adspersus]
MIRSKVSYTLQHFLLLKKVESLSTFMCMLMKVDCRTVKGSLSRSLKCISQKMINVQYYKPSPVWMELQIKGPLNINKLTDP